MASAPSDSWSRATAFCADNNGHIYAITIAGEILVGSAKHPDAASSALPAITRVIQPNPPIEFVVTHAAVSPSGQHLALAGFHEGAEEPALAIVHLRNASKQLNEGRCRVTFVDQQTYWNKPGLKFHQLQWHPYSPQHLAVLTSDLRFRLYNVHSLAQAEQVFHLQINSRSSSYGLRATSGLQQPTSFCFGPPTAWGFFTVFFITATGEIYALCPVAPFGMICPAPPVEQLPSSFPAAAAQLWLQSAIGPEGISTSLPGQPIKVRPHLNDMTVSLQGPLNESALSDEPAAKLAGSCRIAAGHYASYEGGGEDAGPRGESPGGAGKRVRKLESSVSSPPVFCTALLVVDARGRMCGYLMTQPCMPAWLDIVGESVEDAHGGVISVTHTCERVPGESCLELLDLLDLGLDRTRGEHLMGEGRREAGGQLVTASGWRGEEEEEEDDDVYLQLLSSSQELPGQFWLGHHSGVWLISLPWLRVVAEAYGDPSASPSPPTLPEITEHCIMTSSSRSIIGIALMDLNGPLLGGNDSVPVSSCLCASMDVERGVRLHWPMMALPDTAEARLQAWGLPKAAELDSTVEAQHKRLLAGIGKVTLPPPPGSQSKEQVLKYLVESTALLTRHYSAYCQTAHDDLKLRVQQLHDETYSQADKAASLAVELNIRQQRQQSIEERVRSLRESLQGVVQRVEAIMERHNTAPRPLAPQEKQVINDVLPALKEHTKQLESSWHRIQPRLQSALQRRQSNPPTPTPTPPYRHTPQPYPTRFRVATPGFGRIPPPSLAPNSAHSVSSVSNIPESQAAKLFQKMEINNSRLKDARRKLAVMEARLQAHVKTKAAEEIAMRLQPLAERDDED